MPLRRISRKGISNPEDKEGNDVSDKLADKRVEAIAGIGLVRLGKRGSKAEEVHETDSQGAEDDCRSYLSRKIRKENGPHYPKRPSTDTTP